MINESKSQLAGAVKLWGKPSDWKELVKLKAPHLNNSEKKEQTHIEIYFITSSNLRNGAVLTLSISAKGRNSDTRKTREACLCVWLR